MLLLLPFALVLVGVASAKEGKAVVVLGPSGRPLVEPYAPFAQVVRNIEPASRPPAEAYVLVYPLMERGIPMRPGRWYPRSATLCSGWRTGVEAGCTTAPRLRGLLGTGVWTGVFRGEPTRLVSLRREGRPLLAYGNEAIAIEMALNQAGREASAPSKCAAFTGRWAGRRARARPTSFCVAANGGIYAEGKLYPLVATAAQFVIGSGSRPVAWCRSVSDGAG